MGLRRMTNVERKTTRAMASVKLGAGDHKDDVVAAVTRYLQGQAWAPEPARKRARELVDTISAAMEKVKEPETKKGSP